MWTMNDQGYAQLRIEVRPSPETNDHEVRLMADGESLVDRFSTGLIGLDPDDLLTDSCGLRAENESHRVTIGCCSRIVLEGLPGRSCGFPAAVLAEYTAPEAVTSR